MAKTALVYVSPAQAGTPTPPQVETVLRSHGLRPSLYVDRDGADTERAVRLVAHLRGHRAQHGALVFRAWHDVSGDTAVQRWVEKEASVAGWEVLVADPRELPRLREESADQARRDLVTVFAALERELASREMGDSRTTTAKRRVRGACPIGYRYVDAIDGRTVAVNPTECDTVKALFDMYLAMGSLDKLRRMCDLRGWRTRRGGKFTRGALYAILTNPFYAGQRATANGKRVPGDHPALVTPVVFGRVQAALARNARNPGIRGNDPNARRLRVTHGRARTRLEQALSMLATPMAA